MLLEIRHRPYMLFYQILRVTAGDERQEQDEIHLIGELHGGAGKQRDRNPGRILPQRARHLVRLGGAVEGRADQQPAHAGGLGRPADARRFRAAGADRIHEDE